MNRRRFIGALAASAVANAVAGSGERTDARPAVPAGRIFEGMGGAYGAMFTPYHPDSGKLNEEMVEKVVEYSVKTGLTGLYLTGSTGESLLLTLDERKRVYARAKKAANGRLKLIAHVGCLTTDDSCELARYAAKVGMSLRGTDPSGVVVVGLARGGFVMVDPSVRRLERPVAGRLILAAGYCAPAENMP